MDFRILTHRTRQELVALALVLLAASGSCQGPHVGVVESTGASGAGNAGGHDGGMGGSSGNDAGGDGGAAGHATGGSGGEDNGGNSNEAGSGGEAGDNGGSGNEAGHAGSGNSAGVAGRGGLAGSGGGGAGGGGGLDGAMGGVIGSNCKDCRRDIVGTPAWEPTGAIILPASVNTYTFTTLPGWLGSFLEGYHRLYRDAGIFGPGKVHLPPYDEELSMLAAAKADPRGVPTPMLPRQQYTLAEYTAPSGIVLLFSLVPSVGAPMGLAAEFDDGPIIPNSVFPLSIDPDVYLNDELRQPAGDTEYPGYDMLREPVRVDDDGNPIEVEGASHVILAFPLNDTFAGGTGQFQYQVRIIDRNSEGWLVMAPFTVTDDVAVSPY
jgi:hypothetical protein